MKKGMSVVKDIGFWTFNFSHVEKSPDFGQNADLLDKSYVNLSQNFTELNTHKFLKTYALIKYILPYVLI